MLWLGEQRLLLMSREDGWHLLNLSNRTTAEVVAEDSLPPIIEPGQAIGETSIYPNESARLVINAFITGQELGNQEKYPQGSHISRGTVDPSPLGTLLVDVLPLSLAVTTWGLSWHIEALHRYQTTPLEYYTQGLDIVNYPSVWNVSIDDRQVGTFLSHLEPYIAHDDKWYICVQRHDCGIDIYELTS